MKSKAGATGRNEAEINIGTQCPLPTESGHSRLDFPVDLPRGNDAPSPAPSVGEGPQGVSQSRNVSGSVRY